MAMLNSQRMPEGISPCSIHVHRISQNPNWNLWNLCPVTSWLITESAFFQLHLGICVTFHCISKSVQKQQLRSCRITQHAIVIYKKWIGSRENLQEAVVFTYFYMLWPPTKDSNLSSTTPVQAASQRAGPLAAHRPLFLSQTQGELLWAMV
jgi:hypothetical protein